MDQEETPYRIFGSEMSPFSVKVRSWFRYKQVAHHWLLRNEQSRQEYERHARLPLIPLVVTPEGDGLQDSTPIIEKLETLHAEPHIHPPEPTSRFMSYLLEEFGDEWGNKWMFHYRWARPLDQDSAATRIARVMHPHADEQSHSKARQQIRDRMVDRVWFVGSSPETAPQIERSFRETIASLERHLSTRPYLFGGRPALADFGLWAQIYECWTDPTAGSLIEGCTPGLLNWIHRMLWPATEGEFESWRSLEPTLTPLLQQQVGERFLPWTAANAAALKDGAETFAVSLRGETWNQRPQKYHARSFKTLVDRYRTFADRNLDRALDRVACLDLIRDSFGASS